MTFFFFFFISIDLEYNNHNLGFGILLFNLEKTDITFVEIVSIFMRKRSPSYTKQSFKTCIDILWRFSINI